MFGLSLPTLLSRLLILVIALSFHEFAHAWVANKLGDDTPRFNGRLTLNPLAHLDPLGSLMLIFTGFGWAKPVPVNPYALRRRTPAGMMLVSAAGPASNLLLAFLAALPFQMGLLQGGLAAASWTDVFLREFIIINLLLFFFNLIPVFPLDGEKVAEYFLPPSGQDMLLRMRPYGPFILLGLLFLLPMVGIDLLGLLIQGPTLHIYSLLVS